ncbi:hypothetical protein REPUB_Repub01dG0160100 [Reevesia pubescens]
MMERFISISLWLILVLDLVFKVAGNFEGDALNALKTNVADPDNVLQSWDPTLVNPCTWSYVTCNSENSVTRVDLGNANLSGQLVPQLGQLSNLQYLWLYCIGFGCIFHAKILGYAFLLHFLCPIITKSIFYDRELFRNNISGIIPEELGNLTDLVSLDLYLNVLTGHIPTTLGKLSKPRFLYEHIFHFLCG